MEVSQCAFIIFGSGLSPAQMLDSTFAGPGFHKKKLHVLVQMYLRKIGWKEGTWIIVLERMSYIRIVLAAFVWL